MTEVQDLFKVLSGASRVASKALPGPASVIAGAAGEAFGLVADLIEAGEDPTVAIRRIRERDEILADVDREWERAMDDKFGEPEDIYEP